MLEAFFAAQDAADAGKCSEADELYALVCKGTTAEENSYEDAADEPPAHVLRSMALNGRAELALDRALATGFPQQLCPAAVEADNLLRAALREFPDNTAALMTAALFARDTGDAERAIDLWSRAAAPAVGSSSSDNDEAWRTDWLYEPRINSQPLACLYRALLLSQLGRHSEATPMLQRLGYRWRLSPSVWDTARVHQSLEISASNRDDTLPVKLYHNAIDDAIYSRLLQAFAPGAAYWSQTSYETAGVEKRYFTFRVDLDELKGRVTPVTNAIEALILKLLPLVSSTAQGQQGDGGGGGGGDGRPKRLTSCEWWCHQRAAGRGFGHELHYDCEESRMEASGKVLHPAVSSVVYLTSGGDPTIVLHENMSTPLGARAAYLSHPTAKAFFTFQGDLLHGVLPGPFAHADKKQAKEDGEVEVKPRLTLLIAWYSEEDDEDGGQASQQARTVSKRQRLLHAQCALPRVTRSVTWPSDLELSDDEMASLASSSSRPRQVKVPSAAPVWASVPQAAKQDAEEVLCAPDAPRQHFFLHEKGEVGDRLKAEHGIGGSWAVT